MEGYRAEETYKIIGICMEVHKILGPGLLESAYEFALLTEFNLRSIKAINQVETILYYKGYNTGKYYFIDLLIEDEIILEIKCVDTLHPVHTAQVISYLKLAQKKLGFLINFNVPIIKDGIKRYVNNF